MPPTSNVRKVSIVNNEPTSSNSNARRSQSGRAIRINTTRPANYYARPFGSFSAQSASVANENEQDTPPGFFPAITYFTDAITALPKEVMRHFTLLKEVEAKIHAPGQRLEELVTSLLELQVPNRKHAQVGLPGNVARGLLGFGATGSISGSANPSVVNGIAPNAAASLHSARNSVAGSTVGEGGQYDAEDDLPKRKQYHEARILTHQLLANLDEKNTVLAQTNELLTSQLMRLEDVWPYVEAEIPEEARLGSMKHWAYSDNRQKRTQPAANEKNRRDVAATNSLAAAASAIHENDIAAARLQAGREATKEKHKGRHAKDTLDSDFDDRPKKGNAKAARNKTAASGLGITTGEQPVKRRKVEKLAAPGMERSTSARGKTARDTPRSTPAAEVSTKKVPRAKAAGPPKKRGPGSAANSPALASSPLHSSFNTRHMEPPPSAPRPTGARLRQNSTTNLRHEKSVNTDRPLSAAGKISGNNKRKTTHDIQDSEQEQTAVDVDPTTTIPEKAPPGDTMKRQDDSSGRNTGSPRPAPSRANSGRNSKTSTPRNDSLPEQPGSVVRTRSTRSKPTADGSGDETALDPRTQKIAHKRVGSNSHILKQLAPYNRSPDMDRHRKDDMDEDLDSEMGQVKEDRKEDPGEGEGEKDHNARGSNEARPASRRPGSSGKHTPASVRKTSSAISPPPASDAGHDDEENGAPDNDAITKDAVNVPATTVGSTRGSDQIHEVGVVRDDDGGDGEDVTAIRSPSRTTHASRLHDSDNNVMPESTHEDTPQDFEDEEDDEDEESEHDPDDPNEPKYCYCQRGSYGEMVACDNDSCPREWFHLGCTELKEAPGEDEQWYCRECRPRFVRSGRGRGRGRG